MFMSREASIKVQEIDDLLCGTILVHMLDPKIIAKKNSKNSKGVYFDDEDAPSITKAKIVKVSRSLPEEMRMFLENKLAMVNIYSGKDYWKNDETGELLILMNLEGVLSVLKSNKKGKKIEKK
ncbi:MULTISPECIES: hypothetical protein [Bacteria]|uniref:hypothetical protein n=1 Tax=Bacteria TaxID=2 RepID=UPI002E7C4499|nr:hypothetical protein [Cetobacterium somerae]WVJ03146.1 hypothetical protein VSU16_14575 [Cetobacterium somerae]